MSTSTTTDITAQECFNEAAQALRDKDVVAALGWKDIGDGLVRLAMVPEH